MPTQLISYLQDTGFDLYNMREWLSGGAPPCQGGGRGFDPRLALSRIKERYQMVSFFYFRALPGLESSMSTLRSAQAEVPRTSCAVSRSIVSIWCGAHVRGTRPYWAGPCRWDGGRGDFGVRDH